MLDILGNDASCIKYKKLWLLDMDGTIYLGNELIHGTKQFLKLLDSKGAKYVFVTNNSSKSVNDYIIKLKNMGLEVNVDHFFTSSMSSAIYINKNYPNKTVYCMGTDSLVCELKSQNIKVVTKAENNIDIVLLGYDTELNYQKLVDICNIMKSDTVYLATNPDFVCPTANGFLPDCGAISQMLNHAIGRMPKFIGKPHNYIINDVLAKFNISKQDCIIVGDRLYTDIACAQNANIDSICVLSGEAKLEDINDIVPSFVFNNIYEIYNCLLRRN